MRGVRSLPRQAKNPTYGPGICLLCDAMMVFMFGMHEQLSFNVSVEDLV